MLTGIFDRVDEDENLNDSTFDRALRPQCFRDYVGQEELKKKLEISIQAANERNEPLDHTLLFGPPGLGKTTMAHIISKESGVNCKSIVATSIKTTADLIELLKKVHTRDVIFIDEIHALDKRIEETLYVAMEDYVVNIKIANREIIKFKLEPFCLIGATTIPGKMAAPLRDRFGIQYTFQSYTDDELATIIMANADKLSLKIAGSEPIFNLAKRSRGVPRIANRLLRRARDFAQVKNGALLTNDIVNASMELEGVDEIGLTKSDYKYLDAILRVYNTGPVGLQAIAATIGEDKTTVEDFIEPYLVKKGFISRTQKGRLLTPEGMEYVLNKRTD